jgi:glycosyltransferase involved in cell wall biosynthesis
MKLNTFYSSSDYNINPEPDRRKKICVILSKGVIPSACEYIRILNPLMDEDILRDFNLQFIDITSLNRMMPHIAIFNRIPDCDINELRDSIRLVKEGGSKIIYEIDDNLLELSYDHPEFDYYDSKKILVKTLLESADAVITSTKKLASELQKINANCVVAKNFLTIEPNKYRVLRDNEQEFNVLYMGTPTHIPDLEMVLPAFAKMKEEGIDIRLYLVGMRGESKKYKFIRNIHTPPGISCYPHFMSWMKSFTNIDLGIAPLTNTLFNQCKSAIKYYDYLSISVPTMASSIGEYSEIIIDGLNGYIVSDDNWYLKLNKVYEDKKNGEIHKILNNSNIQYEVDKKLYESEKLRYNLLKMY